jgi:quercetin dioxygenase-like cupin family protein
MRPETRSLRLVVSSRDQTFKTGDSFQIPVNAVHDACGVGGQRFKVLGTYIVEKGKPLASPAP